MTPACIAAMVFCVVASERATAVPTIAFNPADRRDDLAGLFGQGAWKSSAGRVRITGGAKAEWNDYSGWNLQPSLVGAKLASRQTAWASVSRSVRTSSRLEHDVSLDTSLNPGAPLFARALGSPSFKPESLISYEAGYRMGVGARQLLDVAAFHGRYDDLATLEPGGPFAERGGPGEPDRTIVPVRFDNLQRAKSRGGDAEAMISVLPSGA